MARKFTSALLSEENEHLPEQVDALNIVLTLMAAMRVPRGWPTREAKEEIRHLTTKLEVLSRSYLDYTRNSEAEADGCFALRIKCDYATAALDRMRGQQNSRGGAPQGRLELGVLGAAGLLDGFVAMDPDSIAVSLSLDDLDGHL